MGRVDNGAELSISGGRGQFMDHERPTMWSTRGTPERSFYAAFRGRRYLTEMQLVGHLRCQAFGLKPTDGRILAKHAGNALTLVNKVGVPGTATPGTDLDEKVAVDEAPVNFRLNGKVANIAVGVLHGKIRWALMTHSDYPTPLGFDKLLYPFE